MTQPTETMDTHVLVRTAAHPAEREIDLSGACPKPLTDDVVRAADHVITMGCGDACPVHPGRRCRDWGIADPSEETLDGVQVIVEAIDTRVESEGMGG